MVHGKWPAAVVGCHAGVCSDGDEERGIPVKVAGKFPPFGVVCRCVGFAGGFRKPALNAHEDVVMDR